LWQAWELKHGTPFRAKAPPAVSVKDQWKLIVEAHHRKKESPANDPTSSPPVTQREQSEVV
jgi:hypothetical protein